MGKMLGAVRCVVARWRQGLRLVAWAMPLALALALAQSLVAPPVWAQPAGGDAAPALREVQLPAGVVTRGEPLPDGVQRLPVPAAARAEPLVLRLLDVQLRVGAEAAQTTQFFDVALQANASAMLGQLGEYEIPLLPAFQRLRLHAVRVLRGERVIDHMADLQLRYLQPPRGNDAAPQVDTGQVNVMLLVPDVRVGDTLSLAFSIQGTNPVFGERFFMFLPWDLPSPVMHRRVLLQHPAARSIAWQALGDGPVQGLPAPQLSERDGWRQLSFEQRDVAAVPAEPAVPADHVPRRMLQFSEYRQWSEVAQWALDMFAPPAQGSEEFDALVRRFAALPDPAARVDAALRWVQGEIRYYALALGENSHRPQPPAVVLQRRFGDCKDKTLLLARLLQALGIPAVPVLVSTQTPALPGRVLPSPGLLDHVVLRVTLPDGDLVLDPTRPAQPVPPAWRATLPAATLGLAVAAGTQAPQALPPHHDPQAGLVHIDEQFTVPALAPEGRLLTRITLHGGRAEFVRMVWGMATPAHRQQIAVGMYERRYPGLTFDGEPELADDAAHNRVTIEARFRVPQLIRQVGGHWVFEFFPTVLQGEVHLPPSLQRTQPVQVMEHPLLLRQQIQVQWPQAVAVMEDPRTRRQETALYEAKATRSFRGNRFAFEFELRSRTGALPPSGLPTLMQDLDRLMGLIDGRVTVDPAEVRRQGAAAAGRMAAAAAGTPAADGAAATAARRTEVEERIARIDAALAGPLLKGADRGEALCLKASALTQLGRDAAALPISAEAVALAPDRPDVWDCRGTVLAHVEQFASAEQALSRALALGSDSPADVLLWRGISRHYQGRFQDAADDFAAAAQARDGSDSIYPSLWRIWSLQRAGTALPADLLALAREAPQAEWPRPALALALGDLTPEAMWQQVERLSGDERTLARVEAWFYLGQYQLQRGDVAAARHAFEQCRAHGVTFYIEHFAAGIELARLPPGP